PRAASSSSSRASRWSSAAFWLKHTNRRPRLFPCRNGCARTSNTVCCTWTRWSSWHSSADEKSAPSAASIAGERFNPHSTCQRFCLKNAVFSAEPDAPVDDRNAARNTQVHQIIGNIHKGSGIMDMARKGFVENGDAFFGRHRQTYLDQGIALAVLLVVTQATQQAALPVEVGVGDIVDHSSRFQTQEGSGVFEDRTLHGHGIESL